ncbi:MAG TPA: hypothetical protein VK729_04860, partial [Silvibacterium sp.]|nr:hypothetical protein [Silvibacterium sp.]
MFARFSRCVSFLALIVVAAAEAHASPKSQYSRLEGAYRFESGGWTYVHLQGSPEQIGFQHGYLLSAEIEDTYHVLKTEAEHSSHRDWGFFRDAGRTILWPHIDVEYQKELQGIAD